MKYYKSILPLFFLLTFFCAANSSIVLNDNDNEKTIKVKKGEIVEIRLNAQLSTGYSWKIKENKNLIQKGKTEVITERKDLVGGIDIQVFKLLAENIGIGFIEFAYIRPWDSTKKSEKSFKINVIIE